MTEIKGALQFNEFNATTNQEWLEKITKDLKGKDFNETLIHENFESIKIQPNYHKQDHDIPAQKIGAPPFIRGWKMDNYWSTRATFEENNASELNKKIIEALQNGVSAISIPQGDYSWNNLFEDIQLDVIAFDLDPLTQEKAQSLQDYIHSCQYDPMKIEGWLRKNWFTNAAQLEDLQEQINAWQSFSNFRPVKISCFDEAQQGANKVHQLGILLSKMNALPDYYHGDIDDLSSAVIFELPSDTQLFMEIAKQRAFRVLFSHFIEQYEAEHACSKIAKIHVQTSTWNFSQKDTYTNLLRNTIAASGAVLGGVDILTVSPFDINNPYSSFVQRMSRNISSILKDESFFSRVVDPAGGAYYVEYLTQQIIDQSWAFFKEVEALGGYFEAQDFIDETIQGDRKKLEKYYNEGGTLVGVNVYQPEEAQGKVQQQTIAAALEH